MRNINRKSLPMKRSAEGRLYLDVLENPGPMKPGQDKELMKRYKKKTGKNAISQSGGLTKGYLKYWFKKQDKIQKEIAKKRKAG